MKKFDLAKEYYKKASERIPTIPSLLLGRRDRLDADLRAAQEERAKLGMKPR